MNRRAFPYSAQENQRLYVEMMWEGNKKYVIILLNKNV